jgi:hypothetical protein
MWDYYCDMSYCCTYVNWCSSLVINIILRICCVEDVWYQACVAFLQLMHYHHVSILEWVSFSHAWYTATVYGGIAPSVRNIGSRWKWVFSLSHRLFCLCGKSPSKHWVGRVVGAWGKKSIHVAVLQRFGESQNATPCSTILVITISVKFLKTLCNDMHYGCVDFVWK